MEPEDHIDRYVDALGTYLVKLFNMNLPVSDNPILNAMLHAVLEGRTEGKLDPVLSFSNKVPPEPEGSGGILS